MRKNFALLALAILLPWAAIAAMIMAFVAVLN